jgi:hypothetical protein
MIGTYTRNWNLPCGERAEKDLFGDLETVLRLGPQWNVKALRVQGHVEAGASFECDVEYDRTEEFVTFVGTIDSFEPGRRLMLRLTSNRIEIDFSAQLTDYLNEKVVGFRISSIPPPTRQDFYEFDLWARSFVNYVKISESRSAVSRAWRWFLDRYWLKMPQSGKRIVFMIVVADGFSVAFLLALLLWWKFFS